jgi:hypothetical protein
MAAAIPAFRVAHASSRGGTSPQATDTIISQSSGNVWACLCRVVGSEAVKGIARRPHWHVPRQGLRHLDLYAGRKLKRDHHRIDHSVELSANVEQVRFSGNE